MEHFLNFFVSQFGGVLLKIYKKYYVTKSNISNYFFKTQGTSITLWYHIHKHKKIHLFYKFENLQFSKFICEYFYIFQVTSQTGTSNNREYNNAP